MANSKQKIKWAPRVRRDQIRRLYEADAQGIIDEELVDEVAYAIYARCQSILTVTEASHGKVKCLGCGHLIMRNGIDKEQILMCGKCSWAVTWGEYFQSYHQKQLHGGGAVDVFRNFVEQFPKLRTPQEKMILIDRIIHECHKGLKEGECNRPVAVNLIAGRMADVIDLLDDLEYGERSTPGTEAALVEWRMRMSDALKRWGMRELKSSDKQAED
jgi:hypothetical protein